MTKVTDQISKQSIPCMMKLKVQRNMFVLSTITSLQIYTASFLLVSWLDLMIRVLDGNYIDFLYFSLKVNFLKSIIVRFLLQV